MGLFADIRAIIDGNAAASGDVRVRDLIATGTVTSHTLDVSVRSFSCEEAQDGGASGYACGEGCPIVFDEDTNPFTLCDGCLADWRVWNDSRMAVVASCEIRTVESIEDEEAAEQEAAERAFLRSFGLGTWLTSQPVRFPTTRVEWGA
jgi:hypothetical protein